MQEGQLHRTGAHLRGRPEHACVGHTNIEAHLRGGLVCTEVHLSRIICEKLFVWTFQAVKYRIPCAVGHLRGPSVNENVYEETSIVGALSGTHLLGHTYLGILPGNHIALSAVSLDKGRW